MERAVHRNNVADIIRRRGCEAVTRCFLVNCVNRLCVISVRVCCVQTRKDKHQSCLWNVKRSILCSLSLSRTHTYTQTGGEKATHGGRGQTAVCEREVVRLPSPQELGGEDLTEEGAGVFDHAHLDVPLVEQFVAHPAAAAVVQGPLARPCAQLGVIIPLRHLPQQRLVLLALIKLVVVQLAAPAATTAVEIHSSVIQQFIVSKCYFRGGEGERVARIQESYMNIKKKQNV